MINDKAASCMEALTAAEVYGSSYMLGSLFLGVLICLIFVGIFYAARDLLNDNGRYLDDND